MTEHNTRVGNPLAYRYGYDQLNRLVNMNTFKDPFTNPVDIDDYKEAITYDPNGNIVTYLRNGATADRGLPMDNLTYNYAKSGGRLLNNRLLQVTDDAGGNYVEDLKTQTNANNYAYDAIGNLTKDIRENISGIEWTVYGKIKTITRDDGSVLEYSYDASGNRIEKKYTKGTKTHSTWYVRDAQGNTMAVYENKSGAEVRLTETHLYGSSRLGIANQRTKAVYTYTGTSITIKKHTFTRGEKFFELTNHLGNVLAVIADKKIPVGAVAGTAVNYFMADVVSATDYYPFGMPMPGRNGIASQSTWVPGRGFVAGNSYPDYLQVNARPYAPTPGSYRAGKEVELLPGFETATGTDELLVETQEGSGVLSNEYAGGEGSYESYGYYRYGFNGKENDNEVKGTGNQQDYGMRIYEPRLGRFLSVDPITKQYPELTPYQFASNRPIDGIDRDGLEYARFDIYLDKNNNVTKIIVTKDYDLKNNGSKGAGIEYSYHAANGMSVEYKFVKNIYGIYQGGDNPQLPKVGENYKKRYDDYRLEPIDETDATAKQHDKDYDNATPGGLKGVKGILDDRSTEANVKYIKSAKKIIEKYREGEKDDVTGQPVTKEAAEAAEFGKKWFIRAEALKGKDDEGNVKQKEKIPFDARHKD